MALVRCDVGNTFVLIRQRGVLRNRPHGKRSVGVVMHTNVASSLGTRSKCFSASYRQNQPVGCGLFAELPEELEMERHSLMSPSEVWGEIYSLLRCTSGSGRGSSEVDSSSYEYSDIVCVLFRYDFYPLRYVNSQPGSNQNRNHYRHPVYYIILAEPSACSALAPVGTQQRSAALSSIS